MPSYFLLVISLIDIYADLAELRKSCDEWSLRPTAGVDLAPGQEAPGLPEHDRPKADSKKDQRGDIDRGCKPSMECAKRVTHFLSSYFGIR